MFCLEIKDHFVLANERKTHSLFFTPPRSINVTKQTVE